MKFLLDQGLPRSAVSLLVSAGHDAIHVATIGLDEADDELILAHAAKERQVIVTIDADFHAHLALTAATAPSVIRLRVQRLKYDQIVELILEVIRRFGADIDAGAVITADQRRIRMRQLPLK